jgi:hypothetical protein
MLVGRDSSVQTCRSRPKEPIMSINHVRRGLVVAGLLAFLVAPLMTSVAHAADVTIFAAASLKNARWSPNKISRAMTSNPSESMSSCGTRMTTAAKC